jgi:hypothetical protein
MRLQGDANNLHGFEVDSYVYLTKENPIQLRIYI